MGPGPPAARRGRDVHGVGGSGGTAGQRGQLRHPVRAVPLGPWRPPGVIYIPSNRPDSRMESGWDPSASQQQIFNNGL